MTYEQNLTPAELSIVEQLPATYSELSSYFGFSESTARDHIASIERKGAPLAKRTDGGVVEAYMRDKQKEHPTNQNNTDSYGQTDSKTAKTKRLNKSSNKLSNRLDRILNASQPAVSTTQLSSGGEEDVAIHVTDDHIGDRLEDEFGNVRFDTQTSIDRIKQRVDETMKFIHRQREAGYDIHTAHYLMGGDIITGVGIYQGQAWEVEKNFNEQIDIATEVHLEQIRRLSEEFEAVQVVCQPGNHGEIRISGSSQKANGDDILYRMLDHLVRISDMENVTLIRNNRKGFTNFEMRGHNAHLRHGDNMKPQSETRAASDDLRGWKLQHKFDILYAGHFHTQGVGRVMGAPLVRSGSIKPPDDFEESISEWSMPASTVHGVTDDRPMTWSFDVSYESPSMS